MAKASRSMKILVALAAIFYFNPYTTRVGAQSDDLMCVEGFVMDKYCIDLGVLLDNRAVTTLENPEMHSVHCLVDVPLCYNTDFTILVPNPSGSPAYAVALTLDKFGKDRSIAEARKNGLKKKCSTCKSGGTLQFGFRGLFFGKIAKEATSTAPAVFATTNVTISPLALNTTAGSNGCPKHMATFNFTLFTEGGSLKKPSIAHGSLMIIGWGFLLPTGVASARFLKHRPNAIWFKAHRIVQVLGLLVALAGWIIALAKFSVFGSPGTNSYKHGVLGMTVMVLGLLQPLNAFFRPHAPEAGERIPMKRLLWEILHKSSGYITILLAAVTIIYGTVVIFGHNTEFQAAWGVTIAWVVLFSAYCIYDGYKFNKQSSKEVSVSYSK